jgi:sensor histidine kinase regulating citrate/malate metabolism
MTISVSDTGEPMPKNIATQLFNAPVPSKSGYGVGLYHAAQYAAQQGYSLSVARNEPGDVCFSLKPTAK